LVVFASCLAAASFKSVLASTGFDMGAPYKR